MVQSKSVWGELIGGLIFYSAKVVHGRIRTTHNFPEKQMLIPCVKCWFFFSFCTFFHGFHNFPGPACPQTWPQTPLAGLRTFGTHHRHHVTTWKTKMSGKKSVICHRIWLWHPLKCPVCAITSFNVQQCDILTLNYCYRRCQHTLWSHAWSDWSRSYLRSALASPPVWLFWFRSW